MDILVLHQMGHPARYRQAVVELETCLPVYARQHRYVMHDAALPLPDFVRDIDFHGVVLGPTFLCNRYTDESLNRVQSEYGFIKDLPAFKIALPQDDYDCSGVLDAWLSDWRVDLTYTVCSAHWDVLYPQFSRQGKIELGYTGYISDSMIRRAKTPTASSSRPVDVAYRASRLPPNYGRLGHLKGVIGDVFAERVRGSGLTLDISTDPADMIPGERWLDFIESARCMLGTSSGSSLLDPDGSVRRCVTGYPSFEAAEAACFPGRDGLYEFTALSPRNIECGLLETAQLLTPGSYSGLLEPNVDYVPLAADASNVDEVLAAIRDPGHVTKIARTCKSKILSTPDLRFEARVARLLSDIENGAAAKHAGAGGNPRLVNAYRTYRGLIRGPWWHEMRGYPGRPGQYPALKKFARIAARLSQALV